MKTVQELIDLLQTIEDKSLKVWLNGVDSVVEWDGTHAIDVRAGEIYL